MIDNTVWMNPNELIPYPNNAKIHPPEQIDRLANGIKAFGWTQPIVVDKNNVVVIGHGRLLAAKQLMLDKVPVVRRDDLSEEEINACRLEDNKTNESPWDFSKLEEELAQLAIDGIDMEQFGFDSFEADDIDTTGEAKGSLKEKYLVPPFSVIYCNKPDWLARKRAWVAKGLHSEIGRGGGLAYNTRSDPAANFIRGGYNPERSKAFKNNSRLNGYQRRVKHTQMA